MKKVCFLVDCSSSMRPWGDDVKTQMLNMIEPYMLIAFVGYRDYGDRNRYIEYPFQTPIEFVKLLNTIRFEGGNDIPEDVAGGLVYVDTLNWDDAEFKEIVHIADAPAHGTKFHELADDRFPKGDPRRINPLEYIHAFSEMGIHYTFIRINESTDTMIDQFQSACLGPGQFQVITIPTFRQKCSALQVLEEW
jgi:hypothetical protein